MNRKELLLIYYQNVYDIIERKYNRIIEASRMSGAVSQEELDSVQLELLKARLDLQLEEIA